MGILVDEFHGSLRRFGRDTSGGITVDWVVLASALVGMALAVVLVVATGVSTVSADIDRDLSSSDHMLSAAAFTDTSSAAPETAQAVVFIAPEPEVKAPLTPEERFAAIELETFNPKQKDRRWDRLNTIPEKNVRNQLQTWTNRANNPDYEDPAKARDQVKLIELAMDARSIPRS